MVDDDKADNGKDNNKAEAASNIQFIKKTYIIIENFWCILCMKAGKMKSLTFSQ